MCVCVCECVSPRCACVCDHNLYKAVTRYMPIASRLYIKYLLRTFIVLVSTIAIFCDAGTIDR